MERKSDTSYYQTQFLISIPTDLTGMTNEDGFFFFLLRRNCHKISFFMYEYC